jgi:hypothetical protein
MNNELNLVSSFMWSLGMGTLQTPPSGMFKTWQTIICSTEFCADGA